MRMVAEAYSAGLMSQSFWFTEFKKAVKLMNGEKTYDEIRTLCLSENLFGAAKEYRAKRVCGYILARVRTMDAGLIDLFNSADVSTQKLINLLTILRLDRLFFEFLYEVYREKVILGCPCMEDSAARIFFKDKGTQGPIVEGWKDTTKRHLQSNYLNFMTEANLLTVADKEKRITPPILEPAFEAYLTQNGEIALLKAITGRN